MVPMLIVALLVVIAVLVFRLVLRLERAIYLLASIKLHTREAKEEHWGALNAIRWLLLEVVEVEGRISKEALLRLHDTPAQLGEGGTWREQMPNNYFELNWRESDQPSAARRLLQEMGRQVR